MKNSGVNYCDSSINPTDCCLGCELWNEKQDIRICYSGRMHKHFHPDTKFQTQPILRPGRMAEARKWPDLTGTDRPERPWLNKLPRLIFLSDMSDMIDAPFEYLRDEVIQTVLETPQHLYLYPTKRAHRLVKFATWLQEYNDIAWPSNFVVGVSVTQKGTEKRIDEIASFSWPLRPFVSYEPALDDLTEELAKRGRLFDWLVFGGRSGVGSKSMDLWLVDKLVKLLRMLREDIALFAKQLGGPNKLENLSDFPVSLRVRDYPKEWYR